MLRTLVITNRKIRDAESFNGTLSAGNPLQELKVLKEPIGIMVRGRWLPRERLQQMLTAVSAN
jgi:hypothetical protein